MNYLPTLLQSGTISEGSGATAPAQTKPPVNPPVEVPTSNVAAGNASAPATNTSQPGNAQTKPAADGGGGLGGMFGMPMIMVLIFVVLYFVLFRGQKKEEKNRKKQISELKKGDEVLLISGKFGKVVDIKEDRVVVKVDEANNVKETYLKSAIQKVVMEPDPKEKK